MENDPTTTPDGEQSSVEMEKPTAPKAPRRKAAAGKLPRRKAKKRTAANPQKPKLVILFRHGIAEEVAPDKADQDRSLTTNGHDRTKRAAKGLSKVVSHVDAIYSSPMLRALQTALWVTKAYKGKVKVQTSDELKPEGKPEEVRKLIDETDGHTILLIGHEPNLSRCLADLSGAHGLNVNLRRAGAVAVRIDHDGRAVLEWMLTPRTLRSL